MALLRGARLCICALVALSGIAMAQPQGVTVSTERSPKLQRGDVPTAYEEAVLWGTQRDLVPKGVASLQPLQQALCG